MGDTTGSSYFLYDFVLVSTLFSIISEYSLFSFYHSAIIFLLRYVAIFFSIVLLGISFRKYKIQELFYVLLSLFLVLIVGYTSNWIVSLWLSFVVIVGARDVPFKHIVKVHFLAMSFFCLTNMFAFEMGWTETTYVIGADRENIFGDVVARKKFGYAAGTDYANHVIFILLDYWLLKEGKFKFWEYLIYIYIGYFLYVNCDARLATLCILLIIFLSPIVCFFKTHKGMLCKLVRKLIVFSMPLFAVLSLCSTFAYDATDLNWIVIDTILSGRLNVAQETLIKYGIPWFGQDIKLYGTGNADIFNAYDYVDSSYTQFYMRWGWLLTSLIIYLYCRIAKEAEKHDNLSLLFSIFLVGIIGVICQFAFHIGYSVLLLAMCSSLYANNKLNSAC